MGRPPRLTHNERWCFRTPEILYLFPICLNTTIINPPCTHMHMLMASHWPFYGMEEAAFSPSLVRRLRFLAGQRWMLALRQMALSVVVPHCSWCAACCTAGLLKPCRVQLISYRRRSKAVGAVHLHWHAEKALALQKLHCDVRLATGMPA